MVFGRVLFYNVGVEKDKLGETIFLREYLATGDAEAAYVKAGFKGDAYMGARLMLKRASIQSALSKAADQVQETAIAKVVEQTKDVLQTRQGLSQWLVSVVRGDEICIYVTKDGEERSVPAHMKERIAAAKLLADIQGLLAPQKHEHEVKGDVFVFHTLDNGRAREIPATVTVLPREDDGTN